MKSVGVAILGFGVVGSGTYKILRDHRERKQRVALVREQKDEGDLRGLRDSLYL